MTYYSPNSFEGYRAMRYLTKAGYVREHKRSNNLIAVLVNTLLDKLEGFIASQIKKLLPDKKE